MSLGDAHGPPRHVNYLRGLNAEFRGLAEVFTAPLPASGSGVRVNGGALNFERQLGGEGRSLEVRQAAFEDALGGPYAVHVYEFRGGPGSGGRES